MLDNANLNLWTFQMLHQSTNQQTFHANISSIEPKHCFCTSQLILILFVSILCLTWRTTVTSVCIPEEDACHRASNFCAFLRVQKGILGLTHEGCVLQRVSLGALSDVTFVLGMRQSIVIHQTYSVQNVHLVETLQWENANHNFRTVCLIDISDVFLILKILTMIEKLNYD